MKLSSIAALVLFVHLSVAARAQKVSLSGKNVPLRTVIEKIKKQTGYNFFYVKEDLNAVHPVTVELRNATLTEALNRIFSDQPLSYVIENNTVVLKKKETGFVYQAAQAIVRGRVTDSAGTPLAGASIIVKRTKKVVLTNSSGEFSINLTEGDVLVVSYVGYKTKEVTYDNQTTMDIVLRIEDNNLSDIVVIGYGTQTKRNVAGAIVTTKATDLNFSTTPNFQTSLTGKVAGLQVTQYSGQPGADVAVQIRSNPSSVNQGILYVLDGVPINNSAGVPSGNGYYGGTGGVAQSILNSINPNDIESITTLKDASSTAIYGAQAGGGVVLITTRKGRAGSITMDYSGSYGFQKAANVMPQFNGREYETIRNSYAYQLWEVANKIGPYYGNTVADTVSNKFVPYYTQDSINNTPILPSAMQSILRSGYTQQHNLSMSGGNEKVTFVASGNYFDQKGIVIGTGYKRYNGNIRVDANMSSKLKIIVNALGSNSTTQNSVYGGVYELSGIVPAAQNWPGNQPLQNADGTYPNNAAYAASPNPLTYQLNNDHTKTSRLFSSVTASYKISSDFTAKAIYSYDQQNAKRSTYFPTTFLYGGNNGLGGSATISENSSTTLLADYSLTYRHVFAQKHAVTALIDYNYNKNTNEGFNAGNTTFVSDVFQYYNLGAGASDKPSVGSYQGENTLASYVARGIYTYDDRLTLQASVRRDGSSAFASNKKWGYFPSVSATYLLFDRPNDKQTIFDLLKIRAGYGEIGNSPKGGTAIALYGVGVSPTFGTGTRSTAIFLNQVDNPNLTWETAAELNLGIDFSLLKNRVSGSFDVYNKTIRNLITYVPFPKDFTVGGVYGNSGTTRDRGYEILLNTRNIVSVTPGGFSWNSSFTFSHDYAFWVKRSPASLLDYKSRPWQYVTGSKADYNAIYGYRSAGIYTGTYGSPAPAAMPGMLPGGLIIKDLHGIDDNGNLTGPDGKITAADQTLIGSSAPKFNFSMGNNFYYKNLELSIFFTGQKLQQWAPWQGSITGLYDIVGQGWNGFYPEANQRWTPQNPKSNIPSGIRDPNYDQYQGTVDYYLLDATFLRCSDITLTYKFSDKLLGDKKTFKRLNLSFGISNAFIITKYPYLDPQIDRGTYYPLTRSFTVGVNAGF